MDGLTDDQAQMEERMGAHVTAVQIIGEVIVLREITPGRVLWLAYRPGWGETVHATLGDARRAARGAR